jgi:hypothetical protein
MTVTVPPTVTISGPYMTVLAGTGQSSPSIQLTATGDPTGGSYSWTANNTDVVLQNTTTATVTVIGTTAGTSVLTVTYSMNGQSGSSAQTVAIQQPTYFFSPSATSVTGGCFSPNHGSFYDVNYYVADQSATRVSLIGMTPLENAPGTGGSFASFASPSTTSSTGSFDDYPVGSCFSTPPGVQACVSVSQTFELQVGSLTENISTATSRRDCALGQSIVISGNPTGQNPTYTQGTVN